MKHIQQKQIKIIAIIAVSIAIVGVVIWQQINSGTLQGQISRENNLVTNNSGE